MGNDFLPFQDDPLPRKGEQEFLVRVAPLVFPLPMLRPAGLGQGVGNRNLDRIASRRRDRLSEL